MPIPITDAELVLMRLLWKEHPLTARQITQRLDDEHGWHRKTVNTLLSRLGKKEALRAEKNAEGITQFHPLLDEAAYKESATSRFVDRLFGGDIAPLVASFASSRKLKPEQIEQLRKVLKDVDGDD